MIHLPWARRSTPSAGRVRTEQMIEEVGARSKVGTEANIAELRAKRSHLTLTRLLEDVIAAGTLPPFPGGHDDGE